MIHLFYNWKYFAILYTQQCNNRYLSLFKKQGVTLSTFRFFQEKMSFFLYKILFFTISLKHATCTFNFCYISFHVVVSFDIKVDRSPDGYGAEYLLIQI